MACGSTTRSPTATNNGTAEGEAADATKPAPSAWLAASSTVSATPRTLPSPSSNATSTPASARSVMSTTLVPSGTSSRKKSSSSGESMEPSTVSPSAMAAALAMVSGWSPVGVGVTVISGVPSPFPPPPPPPPQAYRPMTKRHETAAASHFRPRKNVCSRCMTRSLFPIVSCVFGNQTAREMSTVKVRSVSRAGFSSNRNVTRADAVPLRMVTIDGSST